MCSCINFAEIDAEMPCPVPLLHQYHWGTPGTSAHTNHPCSKHTLDLLVYLLLEGCWQLAWSLPNWRSERFDVMFYHRCPSPWFPLLTKDMAETVQGGHQLLLLGC